MTESKERKKVPRQLIYPKLSTKQVRPYLVEHVLYLIGEAKKLSRDELLSDGGYGHGIAIDMCGVLAWQDASGVENDGWFNEKDEPLLYELLNVSGSLDGNPDQPDQWKRLMELSEQLT